MKKAVCLILAIMIFVGMTGTVSAAPASAQTTGVWKTLTVQDVDWSTMGLPHDNIRIIWYNDGIFTAYSVVPNTMRSVPILLDKDLKLIKKFNELSGVYGLPNIDDLDTDSLYGSLGRAQNDRISFWQQIKIGSAVAKKWGYMDYQGNIVIPAQFDTTYGFLGDIAVGNTADYVWGAVDKSGNTVIDFKYNYIDLSNDTYLARDANNKYTAFDLNGKILAKGYDHITAFPGGEIFCFNGNIFNPGTEYRCDRNGNPLNVIYCEDKEIIRKQDMFVNRHDIYEKYRTFEHLDSDCFKVTLASPKAGDKLYGVIDISGKEIVPVEYLSIELIIDAKGEPFFMVGKRTSDGIRYGLYSRSGMIAEPISTQKIEAYGSGAFLLSYGENNYSNRAIDDKGNILLDTGSAGPILSNGGKIDYSFRSNRGDMKNNENLELLPGSDNTLFIRDFDDARPPLSAPYAPYVKAKSGDNYIRLDFTAVKDANQYLIQVKDGITWRTIATTADTSYTVKNLSALRSYSFAVRGSALGESGYINGEPGYCTATTVPATPANVKAESAGSSSIKISWDKVPNASGYIVYRASSTTAYTDLKTIDSGDVVSFTDTGLTTGEKYYYRIMAFAAVSGSKVYGVWSTPVNAQPISATPGDAPAAPASVKAKSAGYNSIGISWGKVSDASGYAVYRATSKAGSYQKVKTIKGGTALSFTDTKLTAGKKYYYKIRAYKTVSGSNVYGEYSSYAYAKPLPATPTGFKLTKSGSTSITVSWSKVSGASGYVIYRKIGETGTYSALKVITTPKTVKYKNTRLKKGETYYYRFRSYRTVKGKKIYGSYTSVKSMKL